MDKPKDADATGSSATPEAQTTPETPAIAPIIATETPPVAAATSDKSNLDLPVVESPSISPVELVKTADSDLEPASKPIPELTAEAPAPETATFSTIEFTPLPLEPKRKLLRPRHKRYALLAASVAIAAALGGVIGALATGGPSAPPVNVAAQDDNKAMQQTVAKLAKEVTTLRANLEEANKATRAQVAKIDTKIDSKIDTRIVAKLDERLKKDAEEVTGSISAPQTIAAAVPPAASAAVPMPTPRPSLTQAPRIASAESHLTRTPVVPGWSIHDARGGYLYVESRGDIYQIVPGAALPGLGPVESIKRLEGRWVVKTPKGIIVSMRDRRYFE
ncbi:MAG: hypothetical protein Q8M24_03045 [Pseudolabrys sp.]|nr:hypothetical protein [Pseudolabrys sp.]MDP2294424.1 hypothetical protein [Pseudolabrys sp.]